MLLASNNRADKEKIDNLCGSRPVSDDSGNRKKSLTKSEK